MHISTNCNDRRNDLDARARNSAAATTAERELTIRRTFDAPRALVFRVWTEPQHLAQWSCPRGFTMTENRGDLRVGGAFSACMRSPEGSDHRLRGVYREIVAPERLVFTHAWVDASGTPGPETLVTVTFAERNGRTEMTFHQGIFDSVAARDGHQQGWTSCFERLAELLATLARDAAA
jgi:uncharacterized protein YndB with AHSA1/START domain